MKIDWSFPKQIAIALLVMLALSAYPLMKYGSEDVVHATLLGGVLATLNVLFGFAAIEYSFDKSTTTFFKYVLGGMGLRLLVLGALIVLFIEVFHVHVAGLVGSMGVCYCVFLTLEILFIQKKISIRR